jgi:hypothetical protein
MTEQLLTISKAIDHIGLKNNEFGYINDYNILITKSNINIELADNKFSVTLKHNSSSNFGEISHKNLLSYDMLDEAILMIQNAMMYYQILEKQKDDSKKDEDSFNMDDMSKVATSYMDGDDEYEIEYDNDDQSIIIDNGDHKITITQNKKLFFIEIVDIFTLTLKFYRIKTPLWVMETIFTYENMDAQGMFKIY